MLRREASWACKLLQGNQSALLATSQAAVRLVPAACPPPRLVDGARHLFGVNWYYRSVADRAVRYCTVASISETGPSTSHGQLFIIILLKTTERLIMGY